MTTIASALLPSDDEEDHDFDPSQHPDDDTKKRRAEGANRSSAKRRRGAAGTSTGIEADEGARPSQGAGRRSAASKARIDGIWAQLSGNRAGCSHTQAAEAEPGKAQDSQTPGMAAEANGHARSLPPLRSDQPFKLSSLCQPIRDKPKGDSDRAWMAALGIQPHGTKQSQPVEQDPAKAEQRRAAAEAALAAAQRSDKQLVTETRRFAGKDIQFKTAGKPGQQVPPAQTAQERKKAGLDAVLQSLQKVKKVNVLDKSRMDWGDFKSTDTQIEEELEDYKKSGDKYLEKVDFLKRAELREYEKERDQRLGSNMRNRGRL